MYFMERVDILFCNLQSHANTRFSIQPGMNFILAKGNNVGKSTIFRVLTAIASAPKNSSGRLNSLIRTGFAEAYAAFKFNGESVIARFVRREREAPKLFFEHVHPDGQTTRSVACPACLLDALGIALGENELPINFNDADSVQLVSEVSTAADGILTRVLLDSDVEHIKSNLYTLAREINLDSKQLSAVQAQAQSTLERLSYTPAVEEFWQDERRLATAARVADGLSSLAGLPACEPVPGREVQALGVSLELLGTLECAQHLEPPLRVKGSKRIAAALRFCEVVAPVIDLPTARVLDAPESVTKAITVCSALVRAIQSVEKAMAASERIRVSAVDRQNLAQQMNASCQVVSCPVKGDVWYTDEKCLPRSD